MSLVVVKIIFDINDKKRSTIRTNLGLEGQEGLDKLNDLFCDFIRAQMGAGADDSKPNDKNIYSIDIMLDLSTDTFSVKSDTGNKSLTCGIVRVIWNMLGSLDVGPIKA
ncbi:MAG: hypothetical protein PHG66_05200 [Candidatus Colwellbacteria bacterium]|nr:hypothetical protein [Candidatus Colwellbacteria bacterium]